MTTPLVMAIAAVADLVGSAWLVAITETAFGDGAAAGAVYRPATLMVPHAAPAQPWPATPLCTVQLTFLFAEPVTDAKNCCVEGAPLDGETKA